jgi:hypothetical protein
MAVEGGAMSIIQSLKRLFDPIEYRREHQELKRKTQVRRSEGQPDRPPPAQGHWQCRLCGERGDSQYCLHCLAETMERVRFEK